MYSPLNWSRGTIAGLGGVGVEANLLQGTLSTRFSTDGTWDKIHARLVAEADATGDLDWNVSVDSTINRAHQHATTLRRVEEPAGRRTKSATGG